ncbi:hypothetical protein LINGRAHAP2_LOCUS35589 [Linum grandiflorum]
MNWVLRLGEMLVRYLGVPFGFGKLKAVDFKCIVDKITSRDDVPICLAILVELVSVILGGGMWLHFLEYFVVLWFHLGSLGLYLQVARCGCLRALSPASSS